MSDSGALFFVGRPGRHAKDILDTVHYLWWDDDLDPHKDKLEELLKSAKKLREARERGEWMPKHLR